MRPPHPRRSPLALLQHPRAHLWQLIAERLLKTCENLLVQTASLEHIVGSANATNNNLSNCEEAVLVTCAEEVVQQG